MQYGIPYMGSKDKICDQVIDILPKAKHLYDLFGGGFSISHCALTRGRDKWQSVHYNEIQKGIPELVQDAIAGKYSYENFKPEFINRERFLKDKDNCAYTRILWSFGNNQRDYLFGKDREKEKESLHNAVVFGIFDNWSKDFFGFDNWKNVSDITERRLYIAKAIRLKKINKRLDLQHLQHLQHLEHLEQLERLQRMERMQQMQQLERKLTITNLSYEQVELKEGAIIYCDPPYKNTKKYSDNGFNHDEFYNWAHELKKPVFISEYKMDNRFTCVGSIKKRVMLDSKKTATPKQERVFANKFAIENIEKYKYLN